MMIGKVRAKMRAHRYLKHVEKVDIRAIYVLTVIARLIASLPLRLICDVEG